MKPMLAKLSEALFVDTLRRYVMSLPEREIGWLAGTRDSLVGKCLGLMHSRVDEIRGRSRSWPTRSARHALRR